MAVGGGLENQVDRLFEYRSFGYADEKPVVEIGRVQGYERIGLRACVAGQVLID